MSKTTKPGFDVQKDDFLTREQLCKKLGIATVTLRRRIKSGEAPPFVKIGGEIRFPTHLVNQWLHEKYPVLGPQAKSDDQIQAEKLIRTIHTDQNKSRGK
jgi:excisionase family DNA binding protein